MTVVFATSKRFEAMQADNLCHRNLITPQVKLNDEKDAKIIASGKKCIHVCMLESLLVSLYHWTKKLSFNFMVARHFLLEAVLTQANLR